MREESQGLVSCQDFLDRLPGVFFEGATASPCLMKNIMGVCIRVHPGVVALAARELERYHFLVPYEIYGPDTNRWTLEEV